MRRSSRRQSFPFIRAALVLFVVLLAIYIPLKIYITRSGDAEEAVNGNLSFSVFATSDLKGYREPCG